MLSALQQDVPAAFFSREHRFFLTGGAALAGFYLGHRETHDLDLFTLTDVLDDGVALIGEIAREPASSGPRWSRSKLLRIFAGF